jgi:hypothetical protein
MAQRVLFGAFGSSIGTWPPWPSPTKTPGPILTDDLLPMMTLGCGVELDRVPSGQRMALSCRMPRRPSSQVTSMPKRVHCWALAAPALPSAAATTTNATVRLIRTSVPPCPHREPKSIVAFARLPVHSEASAGRRASIDRL